MLPAEWRAKRRGYYDETTISVLGESRGARIPAGCSGLAAERVLILSEGMSLACAKSPIGKSNDKGDSLKFTCVAMLTKNSSHALDFEMLDRPSH